MNKKHALILLCGFLALLPTMMANAATSYFSAVTNLNPVAYWPMHEIEAAAPGDIETNYGTLGLLGTGFYPDWAASGIAVQHQVTGALANDNDTAVFFASYNGNSYTNELIIPHTTRLSTLYPPFSVECWFLTTNNAAVGNDVWSQNGYEGLNQGPTGGGTGVISGMRLFGSGSGLTLYGYNTGQNNIGSVTGLSSNQWYHVVVTCDANTNIALYVNGTQMFSKPETGKYVVDYWMPFEVGNGRGNTRASDCEVDELAIYTNVLSDVSTHYNDGVSGAAGVYFHDVTNDNPVIYLRMDGPAYTAPPLGSWPALTNYGSVGVNGLYTPGTMPGIVTGPATSAGVPFGGLPLGAAVPQLGGMSTFADAGYADAYNPVGPTPFSIAAMFRGNPTDGRVQTIVGHSDNSWQISLGTTGKLQCRLGTNVTSQLTSAAVYNDGNWHQLVEVYTPNSSAGSPGTNALYVDGILDSITNAVSANGILPGTNLDVMIAADPQYTNNPAGAGRQFAGQVCEVALFTNSLTVGQIAALYNSSGIPASITIQPVSTSANKGGAFTNTVTATGSSPLFYQWYQDGTARGGQTNASLILNPVQLTDASTNWYVVVSNNYATVTSSVVSLTVISTASISQDLTFTNVSLFAGGQATLSIIASGALPLRYQWYSNNLAVSLATNANYPITNAQPPDTTNTYYCIVTNSAGSATSLVASVTILPDPTASYPSNVLVDHPFGFWRLNEGPDDGAGDDGVTANDYVGGNDGIYTNVTLGEPSYSPLAEPTDTSTLFGLNAISDCDAYGINIDFGAAPGTSATFSVEAWVDAYAQSKDAGIVTKGYSGGEQFDLDFANNTVVGARTFRFFVRDASGATHIAFSNIKPDPGAAVWHHLVGVCDEVNGSVTLYVDGVPAATAPISPGSGIMSSGRSMIIGSRPSSSTTTANDLQMVGYIADVAVYNYALTAEQAQNHFYAADVPAKIISDPTNSIASQFGSVTFYVTAQGTPPLSYRWFDQNNALVGINSTLVLNNLQSSANGNSYYVVVTNDFGIDQSPPATLQVVSGPPQIYSDVQSPYFVPANDTLSIPVAVYGTLPLFYQWQMSDTNALSWTNLTDNGRITGSSSNVLTINNAQQNDAGDYRLLITNNASASAQSSVATVIVGGLPLGFFGSGIGWTATSRGGYTQPAINNGVLTLTDGTAGEGRAFFFQSPQYIGAFEASYTYRDVDHGTADGVAFVLQNDPRGTSALGPTPGTGLGCNGITPGFDMNVTILAAGGFGVDTNGALGTSASKGVGPVSTPSGDPIDVMLFYANGRLFVTLTDSVAQTSYSTNMFVGDLPTLLGADSALIGFTGADGSSAGSTQTISNFTFISIPTEAIQLNGSSALVSWPGAVSSYLLQQNANLATTNWVTVTNLDSLTNGLHQVTVPAADSNNFYRLALPQ